MTEFSIRELTLIDMEKIRQDKTMDKEQPEILIDMILITCPELLEIVTEDEKTHLEIMSDSELQSLVEVITLIIKKGTDLLEGLRKDEL